MYFSQWPFCHLNFQDNQEHNVPQSSFLVGKGTGKILQDHTTKVVKTSCYLTGSESTGDGYITPEHRRKHYQAEAKACSGLGRIVWVHAVGGGIFGGTFQGWHMKPLIVQ